MNQAGTWLTHTLSFSQWKIDLQISMQMVSGFVVIGQDGNDDGYFAVLMNDGTGTLTAHTNCRKRYF
jgi:hypothetical protein